MKYVKFQGDVLNFCDFTQDFVFTINHHLKSRKHFEKKARGPYFEVLHINFLDYIYNFHSPPGCM